MQQFHESKGKPCTVLWLKEGQINTSPRPESTLSEMALPPFYQPETYKRSSQSRGPVQARGHCGGPSGRTRPPLIKRGGTFRGG